MMRTDAYKTIGIERYDILMSKYSNSLLAMNDEKTDPVTVFEPLTEKQLNELTLIREISRELLNKKDEDLKRAAEAAAAQPEETTVEEEKKEEKEGEEKVSEVVEETQEEKEST